MFGAGFPIGGAVHVRFPGCVPDPQTVDDDVNVNVSGMIVTVRVSAYDGLMPGEVVPAKLLSQFLRFIHGQSVIRRIPRIETDDVMMRFDLAPVHIFPESLIRAQTGDGEIVPAAVQSGEADIFSRNEPPLSIEDGFHADLVMLKGQVLLGGGVVRIFRADMFERCQSLPPWFSKPCISDREGRLWRLSLLRIIRDTARRMC